MHRAFPPGGSLLLPRREISVAIRNVTLTLPIRVRACVRGARTRVYPVLFTLQDLRAASNLADYGARCTFTI
jgi:hypothetical protein